MTRRRQREIPEYAAMVRRVIRAHGRRVGDADPEDLAELVAMQETLDEAIALAVAGQRDNGFAWSQIGRGLGITRQAAQQRYSPKRPASHGEVNARHYDGDLLAVGDR